MAPSKGMDFAKKQLLKYGWKEGMIYTVYNKEFTRNYVSEFYKMNILKVL